MARVSSVAAAAPARRRPPAPWVGAVAFVAAMAVALLALYLVLPLVRGYRLPVGPDGPVYTWWIRYAEAFGLEGVAAGRPGVPGVALALGEVLRTDPVQTVALLGPVLAAASGLAGAAVVEALVGRNIVRATAAALLTGSFAAYLAGGWLANLAQATLLLAAVAALGLAGRSWRAALGGAALLAAAALAHALFTAVGLVVLGGAILALLVEGVRARRAAPLAEISAFRMAAGVAAGAGVGAAALAAVTGAPAVIADTAQDAFLRRQGLRQLLVGRYRERLVGDLTRAAVPVAVGAALATLGGRLLRRGPPRARYLLWVVVWWAAVTVVGVVVLLLTGMGPPNRLLVFGFFLPLAAAVGAETAARRSGVTAVVVAVAVAAAVTVAMWGWYRQSPSLTEQELAVARRAAGVVERLPAGRPVVFVVDTDQPAAAFHVVRSGNVLRMALPPERLPDARVAVGTPTDYLRDRPTLTGDREHDLIARTYLRETRAVRHRAAVLVVEPFNPEAFGNPEATRVAPGVEAWHGVPPGPPPEAAALPTLSPAGWVLRSTAALVLLALLGAGWGRWVLPGAGTLAAASIAPAAGVGVAVLGGVGGAALGGPWPAVATTALGALGYLAAARGPR